MDEARRAELHARRAAILAEAAARDRAKARAEYVRMVPILAALEDAGEDYDSGNFGRLRGPLNHWACEPDRFPMKQERRIELPKDPGARRAAILAQLGERFGEEDCVTVILRSERLMLSLRMPVLIRHFDTLFENAKSNWLGFAAPPADWIVAVFWADWDDSGHIFLGRLPDFAGTRVQPALISTLVRFLDAGQMPYRLFASDDPQLPLPPCSVAPRGGVDWKAAPRSLQEAVPAGDIAALTGLLQPLLDRREPDGLLLVALSDPRAPRLMLDASDFAASLGAILTVGEGELPPDPVDWVGIYPVVFYPVTREGNRAPAGWFAEIRRDRDLWRVRAAG